MPIDGRGQGEVLTDYISLLLKTQGNPADKKTGQTRDICTARLQSCWQKGHEEIMLR